MPTIQLYNDSSNTMTSVSNIFIDEFMPEANGEFVKVYLYLLRCLSNSSHGCTISAIADRLDHTEKDILRALKYWERMGLLKLEFTDSEVLSGIHVLNCESAKSQPVLDSKKETLSSCLPSLETIPSPVQEDMKDALPQRVVAYTVPPVISSTETASKKEYSLDEVKEFQQDETVSELLFLVETYLKRPLSSTDMNKVLFWYDQLHFPTDLIVYLMEYCISKGHSSVRYMDKIALAWKESNISTVEQAKEQAAIHSQVYYGVMKAFGITGRSLVDAEKQFIKKWTKEYGFDMEIILEACKRTILTSHQPSFTYADSILTNWHENHVHTLKDVNVLEQSNQKKKKTSAKTSETPKRNKFNNFNQRDYDYEQLEKILLTTSVQ